MLGELNNGKAASVRVPPVLVNHSATANVGVMSGAANAAAAANWPSLAAVSLDMATAGVMFSWYGFTNQLYAHHLAALEFGTAVAMAAGASGSVAPLPRAKRRKLDPLNCGQSGVASQAEITRLKKRGHVTFKPYNTDDNSACDNPLFPLHLRGRPYASIYGGSGSGFDGESRRRPLKRKHGQSNCSNNVMLQEDFESLERARAEAEVEQGKTKVGNLFPEILTTIFLYLDVKSKGRCARVS